MADSNPTALLNIFKDSNFNTVEVEDKYLLATVHLGLFYCTVVFSQLRRGLLVCVLKFRYFYKS